MTKVGILKTDPNIKPIDQINQKKDVCPWCNYSNDDETKGPSHKKESSLCVNRGHKYQCETCGKMWDLKDLGKPWSEGLERGAQWVRETAARRLAEL